MQQSDAYLSYDIPNTVPPKKKLKPLEGQKTLFQAFSRQSEVATASTYVHTSTSTELDPPPDAPASKPAKIAEVEKEQQRHFQV